MSNPYTGSPFHNDATSPFSSRTGVPYPTEEPSQTFRETASSLRQMYVALVQAGFREDQAMHVVGVAVASAISTSQNPNDA
jgi:hypothetical protein